MRITIPKNDAEAREAADAATLKGWALAGYVASQVRLSDTAGRPTESARSSTLLTPTQFAAKGIRGLRSKDTVRMYVERWTEHVGPPPEPGQVMELPDLDWPPNDTVGERAEGMTPERREHLMEAGVQAGLPKGSKVVDIAANPRSLQAAIKADPATARAAADALASTDEGKDAIFTAISSQPEAVQDQQRSRRAQKAREAADTEQRYHLRGFRALPVLWDAENLAEYIETQVARDPEDIAYARTAGLWLRAIANRMVAWADGETVPLSDDDFAAEIEALLGEGA